MLRDIQNEQDTRGKHLYKVGVSGIKVPISIKQATDKKPTPTVARVSIYTSLDEKIKGVNMSRFSEVLHEALNGHIGTEVMTTMLDVLKKRLGSENSYVKFRFDYFMEKAAPVSKKKSYMVYTCDLEGKSKNGDNKLYLTVRVPYTSLCPCSQAISDKGAHNQRSEAKVTIELKEKYLDIREIIEVVEKEVSCPIFTTLKRNDEKWVTEKAYNNPKFVEDMARDLALALDKWLDEKINDYIVVVTHYESIHAHDAVAIISAGRNIC